MIATDAGFGQELSQMPHTDTLDIALEQTCAPLDRAITDGRAWTRDTFDPQECLVALGEEAQEEVRAMTEKMHTNPLPVLLRHPDQFEMPALRTVMANAKTLLDEGAGVAVIDRLPMDDLAKDTAVAIFWVLGHLIARPVAQKWDGTILYEVTDTGAKFGYGVRGSYTNVELVFHTDNAFGLAPPDYVGLLCHYPAKGGGLSRFCSLYSVHNRMLEQYPQELARLYEPVLWDRQAEHADGAPKLARAPMFHWDGNRLGVRANTNLNEKGYEVAGAEMPSDVRAAIEALNEVTTDEDLWFGLPIERGQIQYLNNAETAHYRSEFTDHDDPALKRHLVRTWHRDWGQQTYDG